MLQTIIDLIISNWTELKWIGVLFLLSIIFMLIDRPWFGKKPFSLALPLDYKIPVIPWTIFIYNVWYPILIFTVGLLGIYDKPVFYHFMTAYVIGCLACYVIFIFFQNEVPRSGEVKGDGLAQWLLRLTRRVNKPYNGFPSIHIFACTMTILAVQTSSLPAGFKVFIWISQIAIAVATLTTRQHVLLDVAGGAFMASLAWILTAVL